MTVDVATRPGQRGRVNEDWTGHAPGLMVVLDGVSAPAGTACGHTPAWFVSALGPAMLAACKDRTVPLRTALRRAIALVRKMHADCDTTGGSPAAAVGIARRRGSKVDYLVLADVALVHRQGDEVSVVSDTRVDAALDPHLKTTALSQPLGSEEQTRAVAHMSREQLARRNTAGGYWVAADDPEAASHALVGTLDTGLVDELALLSDGASSIVTTYGALDWHGLLDVLAVDGPDALIDRVRRIEAVDPRGELFPRFKTSDDAAAAYVHMQNWEEVSSMSKPQTRWQAHAAEIEEGVTVITRGVARLVVGTRRLERGEVEMTFDDGTYRVCWPHESVSIAVDAPSGV